MTHQRPTPPTALAAEAAALRQTGASPLRVGDPGRVGPYVPLALLGSGGMGRVYLARAADDGPGLFAVKVIRPEYAEDVRFQRRFEREAAVHARLGPPYAPRLCGTGFDDELLWMATEYIPGLDLTEAVRGGGALPAASVWRLVADLGRALAALSAAGVVHRDLKPSNVLLSVQGAHLIDFGISKAADASALTGTGNRVGTPAYMSPEYLRTGHCDASSDVFSLAGSLVYAVTGRAPFGDGTGVDVMHRVAFEEPDPQVTGALAAADPELAALLAQCLAKEPGLRPTAGQLVAFGAAHTGADDWPEPLRGEVLARQEAYETLHRVPVERAVRLLPAGRPASASRAAPGPVSRPAPAGLAAARVDPFDAERAPLSSPVPSAAGSESRFGTDAAPARSHAGDAPALAAADGSSGLPSGGDGSAAAGAGDGAPLPGAAAGTALRGAGDGSGVSGAGHASALSAAGDGSALSGAAAGTALGGAGGGAALTGAGAKSASSAANGASGGSAGAALPGAAGQDASTERPPGSAPREAASAALPPGGSRRWSRRGRGMAVAAGVALCAVAAGGLVLLQPDGGTTAAPPQDMETASGTAPGRLPGGVARPGASGVPDRASVAGSADGRADVGGSGDPARPGASGSTTAGSTPGAPASTTTTAGTGTGTGTGTGASASPSTDATTPAAEPPASQPWNTDCTYYGGNGKTGEGDSGKKVLQVQCMLTERGYGIGSGGVNGEFGPETTSAVRAFQGDKGLSADGVVAHATWVALRGSD
ncbi:protein kinase [Streptomyces sp. SS7]|uniref:protein kinase domain-containing protein n=1 Tax=Streptomyces sp. SS7 TaxID=3108485 RepID=UPI0030EC4EA9